jgi:tetratricopeptide (TPR) repeat protein
MLAEVCFQLGFRNKRLSPELGRLDLFQQAGEAARTAGKRLLANALDAIGAAERGSDLERLNRIAGAVQDLTRARAELPAWLTVEIQPRVAFWLDELDRHLEAGDNPIIAYDILPPFFDTLGLPDAQARKSRLAQRAIQILMKSRRHAQALTILERLPEAKPKLAAECYEELGQFAKSGAVWLELGDRDRALKSFRSIPDFSAALNLVRQMGDHSARPSLEWLGELDAVLARRPEQFNRVMTAPEKKLLESMLERGLGVQRKKPAARKKAAAPGAKKAAPKKRAPAKRVPRRDQASPIA